MTFCPRGFFFPFFVFLYPCYQEHSHSLESESGLVILKYLNLKAQDCLIQEYFKGFRLLLFDSPPMA
jgi:hypothetical protein